MNSIISHTPQPPQILQKDDLRKWIAVYLHACRSRNLSGGTLEFYDKKLNVFAVFCESLGIFNISQLQAEHIREFLIVLEEKKHRPAGIHCFYRSIKTFLKWYENEREPENWRNPINKVRAPIIPLEPLDPVSIETIKALLATCSRGQLNDVRDRVSLLVLLDTGMRLAEFLALNREDVDPFTGSILIRSGKGRKPRSVYLGEKARQMLRRYIRERRDSSPALWISMAGTRLTETGLRMMMRRRAAKAAVPVPSPHDFRRAFAIERWRAGVDILTLSKLMGHTSLQVLNRYVKQVGEDLELVSKRSSPVDKNF